MSILLPPHERERLQALRRYAILDTQAEPAFDRLTRLAATVIGAPVALVSLVDEDRQFFKSCLGVPEPWASRRGTPLSHSFCQYAVASRQPLVIEDAREHPLVLHSLAIPDMGVVAYAGIPLITRDGHALGSFCVIDHKPRVWTPAELAILEDLAAAVLDQIELQASQAFLDHLITASSVASFRADPRTFDFVYVSPNVEALIGYRPDEMLGVPDFWWRGSTRPTATGCWPRSPRP